MIDEQYSTEENATFDWTSYHQVVELLDDLTTQAAGLGKKVIAGKKGNLNPKLQLQELLNQMQAIVKEHTPAPEKSELEFSMRDLIAQYWTAAALHTNTVKTGFKKLDDYLSGGLEPGRLVGVLGTPNIGKTTFCHQIAEQVAGSGRPVFYVGGEDTPNALLAKTIARVGEMDYTSAIKGHEVEDINETMRKLSESMSIDRLRYFDFGDGIESPNEIIQRAEVHFSMYSEGNAEEGGPGVLVVDYAQKLAQALKGRGGFPAETMDAVSHVSTWMRSIAKQLQCTVLAIYSQNRSSYTRTETSGMAAAKGSGDVEYTCDVLLALAPAKDGVPSIDEKPVTLHIDKNRQGMKDVQVPFKFYPYHQAFVEG